MGVSSNMHVCFNQALSLRELERHLVGRGWSFDWDGQLIYWQDDWVELPHAMLGSVLSQYENRRSGFFLAMYHTGEEERSRIHLGFSKGDKHAIVLDCSTGGVCRPGIVRQSIFPGTCSICCPTRN
jgi:hypothetical protein